MRHIKSLIAATVIIGCLSLIVGLSWTEPASAQDSLKQKAEDTKTTAKKGGTETVSEKAPDAKTADPEAPYSYVQFEKGEKPHILMETSMGPITLELWPDVAPKHCQSFVHLTKTGFYDSLTFHRVIPGFVIQGGCPLGNGTGGPGYRVPAEFSNKKHEAGILSMARSNDPNSAGSQFFICLGRAAHLDNAYTVFGKVIDGMDVVRKIEAVDKKGSTPVQKVYMTKVSVLEPEAKEE
jgi:peptidyl-prolyl cis-trans isomerase B (cyclophilin B)